jgi:hypothetical protein
MNYVTVTLVASLGLIPSMYSWIRQRYLRKLSESRLEIAKTITGMEQLMLDGDLSIGDTSHDTIFRVMMHAQNADSYAVNWAVVRKRQPDEESLRLSLHKELQAEGCPFRDHLNTFTKHYFRAFKYSQPFRWAAYILWLFTLAGGLLLIVSMLVATLRGVDAIRKARRKLWEFATESFVIHSGLVTTLH